MNNEKLVCCNCNTNFIELNRPLRSDWYSDWYVCNPCRQNLVERWYTEPEITTNTFDFDEVVSGEDILDVEDIEKIVEELERIRKFNEWLEKTRKLYEEKDKGGK